jgi:hypothetical protein
MCVGNSDGTFKDGGGNRVSDLAWATDGSSGSKQNAGYVQDPFGYNRLSPTNAAGQPLTPAASTLLKDKGICMPPFTQLTVDLKNSQDNQINNLVALASPFDVANPADHPSRYVTLFANTWSKCTRNIGTCVTNQGNDFQLNGGDNFNGSLVDEGDYSCQNDVTNDITFTPMPFDTPPPNNFTFGAFDTGDGVSDAHQGWQNRQSILSLSPGLGAEWQGSRYLEEDGGFGCNGGCHGRKYGCFW